MTQKPVLSRFFGVFLATFVLSVLWSRALPAADEKKPNVGRQLETLAKRHCAWLLATEKRVKQRNEAYETAVRELAMAHRLDLSLIEPLFSPFNYGANQIPAELIVALAKLRLGKWEQESRPTVCLFTETDRITGISEVRLFLDTSDGNSEIRMAFRYEGEEPLPKLLTYMGRFLPKYKSSGKPMFNEEQSQFIVYGAGKLVDLLNGLEAEGLLFKRTK
jgi:hypothetical protein